MREPAPVRVVAGEDGLVVPAPGAARRGGDASPAGARHEGVEAAGGTVPRADLPDGSGPADAPQPAAADQPSGPPSLRVVPRPVDDVDDEPAADVS